SRRRGRRGRHMRGPGAHMKPRRSASKGPKGVVGSEAARRHAALVLQSLSGVCGPLEAARGMGGALARYYQLEARAPQALVRRVGPRPRGRQESEEARQRKAADERRRLERELHRYQALYRTVQKTLGVAPPPAASAEEKAGKRKRRMRRVTRGERVAKGLVEFAGAAAASAPAACEGSAAT